MPMFEYQCPECKYTSEEFLSFEESEKYSKFCMECFKTMEKKIKLEKVISATPGKVRGGTPRFH
jgi:protein-arginine kinase activator protein McsA